MIFQQLTRNFHEREFFPSSVVDDNGVRGTLPAHHDAPTSYIRTVKLPQVAARLQWLRDLSGSPGTVVSYYRSPARGAIVAPESVDTSQHGTGEAVDAKFLLIAPRELARRCLEAKATGRMPAVGQLIFYPDTTHVHVSTPGATKRDSIELATRGAEPGPRRYASLSSSQLTRLSGVPGGPVGILIAVGVVAVAFFFPGTIA